MKNFRFVHVLILSAMMLAGSCQNQKAAFVRVEDGKFSGGGTPSHFIGTNFWYGAILGSEGRGGNRERLEAELDTLKALGLTNLRVLVGGDGPDGIPTRVTPNLQTEPGVYNDTIFRGLDYLLAEMAERDMKAVLFINNSWEWSGGYGMYLEWAGAGKSLIPAEVGYDLFMESVSHFVTNEKAKELFYDHVRHVVGRTNTVTGKPYSEDPAIFSWQIGNEPRCFRADSLGQAAFVDYMWTTAALIKSIDPNHMVSSGSEGMWGSEYSMDLYEKIHSCPDIDYMNIHIWPYNWGWVHADALVEELPDAIANTDRYIDGHLALAAKYGKPVVLEEFGYPRDGFMFAKGTPTTARDEYYRHVFGRIEQAAKDGGMFAGLNFWGWGGLASQSETNLYWKPGDDYCGDPGQEQQGLNSVYACDASTIEIIKNSSQAIETALGPKAWYDLDESKGIFTGEGPHELEVGVKASTGESLTLTLEVSTDFGDPLVTVSKKIKMKKDSMKTAFSLDLDPGFYKTRLSLTEEDGSSVMYSSNIGVNPEQISSPQDKRPDFDEFWERTLAELASVAPEYRFIPLKEHSNDVREAFRVEMKSLGGETVSGLLYVPVAEGRYPAKINYMGYGSDVWYAHPSTDPELIEFTLCIRGQALNRKPGEADDWCGRGLASKETYYYRGAFADAVRAVDLICSLDKADTERIVAQGDSQGGALTLIAASLDPRIKAAAPAVPFLSDYRDYFALVNWPGSNIIAAAEAQGVSQEEMYEVLSYFDVKNFTDRIKCPVIMAIGLQDGTCPPHINLAAYNQIKSEKSWSCYPYTGHDIWMQPGWDVERRAFFAKVLQTPGDVLLDRLAAQVEDGKIMFGHQDTYMYGHSWKMEEDAEEFVQSDVKASCGKYPAVYGMDLGGIEMDWPANLDNNDFDNMRASAAAHHERGGIVTFSWHPRNPLTGGDAWDVSSDKVVRSVLPGGEKHELFMSWLKKAADFMESIRTADGSPVPIVWRPWHEHTGSWFWWGQKLCTVEQYKALWQMTYDYMVGERGMDQLVWAYSPGAGGLDAERFAERYPGDGIIDIVGFDCYQFGTDEAYAADMKQALDVTAEFASAHGKLTAVTETGREGIKSADWWTSVLYPAIKDYPVSYVLLWRNACDADMRHHFYAPFPEHESASDFKAFSELDQMMFL